MSETPVQKVIPMIKDLLHGDEAIIDREDYNDVSGEDVRSALKLILNNVNLSEAEKAYFISNSWKISYAFKPPTVEEFLTPTWLGVVGDQIYPHVRETIGTYLDPLSDKRVLALSTCISYGKASSLDSKIYTPNGYTLMGDIKIGDIISTPNGKTSKVIAIHPQGVIPLYRITFRDGRSTAVSGDHLWKISNRTQKDKFKIMTTQDLIDQGLTHQGGYKWFIPLTQPVRFKEKSHLISPYIMGALLGDGCFSSNSVAFSCDPLNTDIINRIESELPENFSIKYSSKYLYYITRNDLTQKKPSLKQEIKRLDLDNKIYSSKFIPNEYLYDSVSNRIDLLRGLMDTDGTASNKGKAIYYSSSKQLIDGVVQLVRSLGGTATLRIRNRGEGHIEYESSISFINMNINPFYLAIKKDRVDYDINRNNRKQHNTQRLSITNIKRIEDDEAQCITIEDSEGLYLTDNYIVTHNSTIATLISIYVIVHVSYMRNPKQFYGLNEAGSLVIALLSFTKEKANQVLLQPFANILNSSPMFERTTRENRLQIKQDEIDPLHIAYTSAGRMGAFQFTKDIHITTMSDRAALLGLNILLGIASEISFWIKKGIAVNEIWESFTDLRERVNSRFHSRYLSGVILDSSPLDLSISPIDKWIYGGGAEKDHEVMIVNATHWDIFPERYPEWRKTGKTFPVFRGNAAKPPLIIEKEEIDSYASEDIIHVPIDKYISFKNNIKKQIADFAAWPSGGLSKVVDDISIINNMFSNQLSNIYSYAFAPSNRNPEKLIWNQIVKDFFIILGPNRYQFYRAPNASRTLHIDLSESGDVSGVAMCHYEITKTGDLIIVFDFAFGVSPEHNRINIDAITGFIIDLKLLGNINIAIATADQYQSASMLQRFKREGIEAKKLSVDKDMAPYRLVVSWIENGRVKAGKNIVLKNNFGSLVELITDKGTEKIDHTKGTTVYDDGGNWKQSFMGIHAKDISDAFVGAAYNLITEIKEVPIYQWEDDIIEELETSDKNNHNKLKDAATNLLMNKYGLKQISS